MSSPINEQPLVLSSQSAKERPLLNSKGILPAK